MKRKYISSFMIIAAIACHALSIGAQTDDEIINAAISFVNDGITVTLPVKGKSMTPFIMNGENVLLEKSAKYDVGDIVLAHLPEKRFVIHRVFSRKGDSITLMGDGNLLGKEHCHLDSLKALIRYKIDDKGNKIPLCSDSQKARSELWRVCLSQRKMLLSKFSQGTENSFWEELFRTCIISEGKLKLTIRPVYETKKIGNKIILISKESDNIDFSSLQSLNETASFLFSSMKRKQLNLSEIVEILMKEYDVDKQIATKDCVNMLTTWFALGVIRIDSI